MLLNLHYYRKDKFLTLDYMRCYFNLQIAFLGLEFCKPLCNGSAIAIKVFWRYCNVDRKEFGPAFSSVNFFDNSLERLCWTMFRRQSPGFFLQKRHFFKNYAKFTGKHQCLFFNKIAGYRFFIVYLSKKPLNLL